jgi:hypothetical protein
MNNKHFALFSFAALTGVFFAILTEENEDSVNYHLYNKGKLVYTGITFADRLQKRLYEHKRDGKVFDSYTYSKVKKRTKARKHEIKRISINKPHYNKIS